MRSGPDYIVKIEGLATPDASHESRQDAFPGAMQGRPWIAVRWQCCSAYSRIYRNRAGSAYEGRCPKCGTSAKATVGPGGTNNRFFNAG